MWREGFTPRGHDLDPKCSTLLLVGLNGDMHSMAAVIMGRIRDASTSFAVGAVGFYVTRAHDVWRGTESLI